jgi:hypothetical protein
MIPRRLKWMAESQRFAPLPEEYWYYWSVRGRRDHRWKPTAAAALPWNHWLRQNWTIAAAPSSVDSPHLLEIREKLHLWSQLLPNRPRR